MRAHMTCLRRFSNSAIFRHDNPLGLPRSGTPPNLAARMKRGLPEKTNLPNVGKIVAVSSAKGGVGKSTIAANLALALARQGFRTGLLDTDIFGPSVPSLFNLSGEPRLTDSGQMVPLTNYGVATMSIGYLIDSPSSTPSASSTNPTLPAPVVWRGLMLTQALHQLLHSTAWPALDVLVLDMPPGTGDVQLTITQRLHVHGAVVVSTPQHLSTLDASRGLAMFKKVGVPVLGVIQNMSVFVCPGCGLETRVFGGTHSHDHPDGKNDSLDSCPWPHPHPLSTVPFLGHIPLDPIICADADAGKPTVVARPDSAGAKVYGRIATQVAASLGLSRE